MGKRRTLVVDSVLGQHLALSVAAHLARSQLISNRDRPYDSEHLLEVVDVLARALVKTAPIYVRDRLGSEPRELGIDELEGAAVIQCGQFVVLSDGRKLSPSIKRSDLRDAIALLSCVGVPGLKQAPPHEAPTSEPDLAATVEELERLLKPPFISAELEKAHRILIRLARDVRVPGLGNIAMRLMTALNECHGREALSETAMTLLAELRAPLPRPESRVNEESPPPK